MHLPRRQRRKQLITPQIPAAPENGSVVSTWQRLKIQQHWKTGSAGTVHETREYRATRALYSPRRQRRQQVTTPENPAALENVSAVNDWQRQIIQQIWKTGSAGTVHEARKFRGTRAKPYLTVGIGKIRNCPRNTQTIVRQGQNPTTVVIGKIRTRDILAETAAP